MGEFSPKFLASARQYVEEGRGLIFKPNQPIVISDEELVPKFFDILDSQYKTFVVNPIPGLRQDQEDAIAADLESGNPVLLRSFWRTGQSSLLASLVNRFGTDRAVKITFLEYKGTYFQDFPSRLAYGEVARVLDSQDQHPLAKGVRDGSLPSLNTLDEYLLPIGKKAFLGVEEILELSDSELSKIASLRGRERLMLYVGAHINSGDDRRVEVAFSGFNTHYLRPLNNDEVGELIRTPLQDTPVKVTDQAIDAITEYSGGWPIAAMCLFKTLIERNSPFRNLKQVYEKDDIDALIAKDPKELFFLSFGGPMYQFARIYHEGLGSPQQAALDIIAKAGELKMSELDPQTTEILIKSGLVIEDNTQLVYRINGTFLQRLISTDLVKLIRNL